MEETLILIIDKFRKRKALEIAIKNGCDWDGDIVTYKNTRYFVDLRFGLIKRIK